MEVLAILSPENDVKETKNSPVCPVDYAFQRIGGKYKARILWALYERIMRYGELRRRIADSTPKMLTQVLKELEHDGLINRKVYFEMPPKVEYSLTGDGRDLMPFIQLASEWATKQMEKLDLPAIPK
jgi:DNA-binding HxlR family transcriptional regulator